MSSGESNGPHSSQHASSGEASSSSNSSPWTHPTTAQEDASNLNGHDFDFDDYLDGPDRDMINTHHNPQLGLPLSAETPFPGSYLSDDYDMDEGGAPVDYLGITDILTQGMDMDSEGDGISTTNHQAATHHPGSLASAAALPPLGQVFPSILSHQSHHQPAATMPVNHIDFDLHVMPPHFPPTGSAPEDGEEPNNTAHHVLLPHHPQMLHPAVGNVPSNPHTTALGPENYNLADFIRVWAWQNGVWQGISRERGRYPWPDRIGPQISQNISRVDYMDLDGDRFDVQGMDWEDLGVTRSEARERRLLTYKNYVNIAASDRWQEHQDVLPCTENYFRFRSLDVRKNINLTHFQLRNVLASTSRTDVFYPGQIAVHHYNPVTGKGKVAMKAKETPHLQVSTLAADYDVLIAGGFFGEYCFRRIYDCPGECNTEVHEGTITNDQSGITNHVQLHQSRNSSSPRAAFASNDRGFRVLDIATDKFVSETLFQQPINCSAISPDRRLRVMVGDQRHVFIAKAEADGKPEILQTLGGHEDFGFACDWADDGWTVATGFQDKSVKIWDARRWTNSRGMATPVCTLRSEMAGVRALRFSPLGSGKRVLVAAEEADFVNIIDAQTFQSKQTFDFFGEIGGISFVNDGQDLHVLNCDRIRGGLFQLERCGAGAERNYDPDDVRLRPYDRYCRNTSHDWHEFKTTPRRLRRHTTTQRRRRGLDLAPFEQ